MSRNFSCARFLAVIAVVALLAGCASPASREGMTVTGTPVTKKYPSTVAVKVTGGTDASASGGPNVGNEEMKAAIEASIRNSSLFKSIVASDVSDYALSVFITRIDRPSIGFSFTVEMEAGWSLVRVSDRSVAMRKVVTSSFTATMSDSVAGATRIRLAVEGAARNNIANGLQAVSALGL